MSFKSVLDGDNRQLKQLRKEVVKINAFSKQMEKYSDQQLQDKTAIFKALLHQGSSIDEFKYEAIAVIKEAVKRVLGLSLYDEQLMAGLIIFNGDIVEFPTGSGKSVTATIPAYLNALYGKGVHVITVNEYLASRDAEEMGEVYGFLGLTTGINLNSKTPDEKKRAYACDITYTTNAELGFDYLRDNMAVRNSDRVLRGLAFAIIDEADSVLIDEAKTPLIISTKPKRQLKTWFNRADRFVKTLSRSDVDIDISTKTVSLTASGLDKVDKWFRIENLYDSEHIALAHYIGNALQANFLMTRDKDYIVADNKVELIDAFTGRVMEGRRFSDGLHQALEAKENVEIQDESVVSATITYQNFFRLYDKISGMTGTAKTEEEELREIYNFRVIPVPSHQKCIREDKTDILYPSLTAKYHAIIEDVKAAHKKGQPVLIGTVAVETSALLSSLLSENNIPHEVLNAKNHEKEAQIIMNAGQQGAVTIATNMAGRGTDIKLGSGVRELGGLYVIGTERHESRRIDNQLRGRSGRQGDPGKTQFYLSLEDDLLQRFGSDGMKKRLVKLSDNIDPIRSRFFTRQVESAQKRIEGNNYDNRKQVLEFDDIISKQRDIVYGKRDDILNSCLALDDYFTKSFKFVLNDLKERYYDKKEYKQFTDALLDLGASVDEQLHLDKIEELMIAEFQMKMGRLNEADRLEVQKILILTAMDNAWLKHIDELDKLKRSVNIRSFAQKNPTVEFLEEAEQLYDSMAKAIKYELTAFALQGSWNAEYDSNKIKNTSANGDIIPHGQFVKE